MARTEGAAARGDAAGGPRRKWLRLWATAADPRMPWVQWIGLTGVLVGVITGVVTLVHPDDDPPGLGQSASPSSIPSSAAVADPTPTAAAPRLAGPLHVANPVAEEEAESVDGAYQQSAESLPTLEIALLNTGSRRTVFTGARFDVREFGTLDPCISGLGSPLTVSSEHDVVLPLDPPLDFVVDVPMSQQLAGDEADRVAFRLGNPELGPSTAWGYLYLLDVRLVYGPDQSVLDAGRALVSLPGTPTLDAVGPGPGADPACVRQNRDVLAAMVSDGVAMSPELARLAADLAR